MRRDMIHSPTGLLLAALLAGTTPALAQTEAQPGDRPMLQRDMSQQQILDMLLGRPGPAAEIAAPTETPQRRKRSLNLTNDGDPAAPIANPVANTRAIEREAAKAPVAALPCFQITRSRGFAVVASASALPGMPPPVVQEMRSEKNRRDECLPRPPATAPVQTSTTAGSVAPSQCRPGIGVELNFEYDSAELRSDTKYLLDQLATALNNPDARHVRFLLAGHTDARGAADYNMRLSERRAEAVRNYLIRQHHVESSRLQWEGRGEEELRKPEAPCDAANRRVDVINLPG